MYNPIVLELSRKVSDYIKEIQFLSKPFPSFTEILSQRRHFESIINKPFTDKELSIAYCLSYLKEQPSIGRKGVGNG